MRALKICTTLLIVMWFAGQTPSAANTSRWVFLTETEGRSYFVDADAVTIEKMVVTIWLKTVLAVPRPKGEASAIEKWMHDCENDRAKLLAVTIYKSDGRVISSGEIPHYEQAWKTTAEQRPADLVHNEVCKIIKSGRSLETLPTRPGDALAPVVNS